MSRTLESTVELNDGNAIPQLGFGVYLMEPGQTREPVATALDLGYRHVDTASGYRNEAEVGEAVRAHDGDVWVTTKYFEPSDSQGYEDVKRAYEVSRERLGVDRTDLYLVHWPVEAGEGFAAVWRAFGDMRDAEHGPRSIGVANFSAARLEEVIDATGVTPAVNQVELHPYLQQRELRAAHAERGIVTEAWGPLGQGHRHDHPVLEDPVLKEIGVAHGVSVAQVVVRWHLQLGTIVIPKSVTPERIAANADVFGFELSDDEMAAIEGLDRGQRNGPDPDEFQFPKDYLD